MGKPLCRSPGLALSPLALLAATPGWISQASAAPPNIVLFLAEDLGFADTGCYGAPEAKTPAIAELAAGGLKFNRFDAMAPQCTPSRVAIPTGRYAQRAGGLECAIGTDNVGRYDEAKALAAEGELELPSRLAVSTFLTGCSPASRTSRARCPGATAVATRPGRRSAPAT